MQYPEVGNLGLNEILVHVKDLTCAAPQQCSVRTANDRVGHGSVSVAKIHELPHEGLTLRDVVGKLRVSKTTVIGVY